MAKEKLRLFFCHSTHLHYLCQRNLELLLMQTIDTYKLTSMEEPSDEILAQIMHEAAVDAKKKGEAAHKLYFDHLRKYASEQRKQWFSKNPEMLAAR